MKHIGKIAVLGAVLAASASFAFADTITLASFGTAGNSITNPTEVITNGATQLGGFSTTVTTPTPGLTSTTAYDLNPGTTWIAPLGTGAGYTSSPVAGPDSVWVGYKPTAGPGGTPPAAGYYTFTSSFSALGGSYSGDLDVLADDTVAVYLNGSLIPALNFGTIGSDNHCADNTPNCSTEDNATFSNLTLLKGNNTLQFVVEQTSIANGSGNLWSGLDFDGSLSLNPAPEPSSLMLLGTGLVGAAGAFLRKRVTA